VAWSQRSATTPRWLSGDFVKHPKQVLDQGVAQVI
jgi:hypothetical protein